MNHFERAEGDKLDREAAQLPNKPQLITFADRLAGDLGGLQQVLVNEFAEAFGGVHLLSFIEEIDGADAGFDPSITRSSTRGWGHGTTSPRSARPAPDEASNLDAKRSNRGAEAPLPPNRRLS